MNYSEYNASTANEIKNLFIKTFSDSEGEEEGLVIGELVNNILFNTDNFYCFVATDNDKIIGSVFFTELTLNNTKASLLSPMATLTEYQGKGFGQELINFGINTLKNNGTELVMTYGDINFYSKVGFSLVSEKVIKAPYKLSYPEGWLGKSLISNNISPIAEKPQCAEAFHESIW
ncbi:MAG: N-acetyltransferase [Ichthyobacteriaceae bacterium]|nr:N-acetyltransferase [Ichthyobacteriaceae bacterium]